MSELMTRVANAQFTKSREFRAPAVVSAAALSWPLRPSPIAVLVNQHTTIEAEALSTWLPGKTMMTASDVEAINARNGI